MEENGNAPYSFSSKMDLNQPPVGTSENRREPTNLTGIKFECRPKASAKTAIIRRFGESGYEKIIGDQKPFLMLGLIEGAMVILVLY